MLLLGIIRVNSEHSLINTKAVEFENWVQISAVPLASYISSGIMTKIVDINIQLVA